MKYFATVAGSLLCALATTMTVSAGEPPYEINVIAPLTGSAAFLGKSFQDALAPLEATVNAAGGIRGRTVKFVVTDSQTNAPVGLQIVNTLAAKHVPFFIDGGPSTVCNASSALLESTGPLDYCLSPVIAPAPKSYIFSAGTTATDLDAVGIRFLRTKGFKRIATLSSTDSTGQANDRAIALAVSKPENADVHIVANEHFNPTDISVAAQLARIEAAKPDVLFVSTTGTPFGTVMRGLKDAGSDLPILTGNGNMSYAQMAAYAGVLPRELYFTTWRGVMPEDNLKGPLGNTQGVYFNAFRKFKIRPDIGHNLIWDPVMLMIDALRHLGPAATADQIRAYVLSQHSWLGIDGTYDFTTGDQRGLGENSVLIARWDAARSTWSQASKPNGEALR